MIAQAEVKTVTAQEAGEILRKNVFERQRKPARNTISYYRDQMLAGQFLPGTTIELCTYPNGDGSLHEVLTDGQQRLLAQVEAQVSMIYTIRRVLLQDEREVEERYGKTDIGRTRNIVDYIRAVRLDQQIGIPIGDTRSLLSAVAFLEFGFSHPNRYSFPSERKEELAHKYAEPASLYLELIVNAPESMHKMLVRSATFSVALATLSEATTIFGNDFVEGFWTGVAHDDGLRRNDPRKVTINHLRDTVMRQKPGQLIVSAAYSARYIANCWNAYADKREINFTRVSDATAPIVIKGTHWDGSKR